MRYFYAALAALVIMFSSPAFAGQCVPLAVLGAQMKAASIPAEDIHASEDISFVNLYTKAVGVPLPDDAEPVGILLVSNGKAVFVGIVENQNGHCIRYRIVIPVSVHQKAFAAASRQA